MGAFVVNTSDGSGWRQYQAYVSAMAIIWRCVWTVPLGWPVVPLV
jgi:hypothetical protein